jgi:hypothetical protein
MVDGSQTIRAIRSKVGVISDIATKVLTLIRTQMPYPFVHLVSFIVHFYLFFWASYVGCLLNAGIDSGVITQVGSIASSDMASDGVPADDAWVRGSALAASFSSPLCTRITSQPQYVCLRQRTLRQSTHHKNTQCSCQYSLQLLAE